MKQFFITDDYEFMIINAPDMGKAMKMAHEKGLKFNKCLTVDDGEGLVIEVKSRFFGNKVKVRGY